MRNVLYDTALWDHNVGMASGDYVASTLTGNGSFRIFLINGETFEAASTLAFEVNNEGTDTAAVDINVMGYQRTVLAPPGITSIDLKDELPVFLLSNNIETVTYASIEINPTIFLEGYTFTGDLTLSIIATAAAPSPLDLLLALINDYILTQALDTVPLTRDEITFGSIYEDPDDVDKTIVEITISRAGATFGPQRCRYSRLVANIEYPSGVNVADLPFGTSGIVDVLPTINDQTGVSYLPVDFENGTITNPIPGTVNAVVTANNAHIVGELELTLPAAFDPTNSKYDYFGTHPSLNQIQTHNFSSVFECTDPSAPDSSYLTTLFAGRNQKVYALRIDDGDTVVFRSANGGGIWNTNDLTGYSSTENKACFFKGQFYFLGIPAGTGTLCLLRAVEVDALTVTVEYVCEVGGLDSDARVFATEEHIGLMVRYETAVAYTYATQIVYSADCVNWSVQSLEHGLTTTSEYLGAGNAGNMIAVNGNRVFIFGGPGESYGDYAVGMVTLFGELGSGVWTVDEQAIYPDFPDFQINPNLALREHQFEPLPDGRIVLYVKQTDGGTTITRNTGNLHVFDPEATAGSRWSDFFTRSGISSGSLVVKGYEIRVLGQNYDNPSYGGGPHSNAFSPDAGATWIYDFDVTTFSPYYSLVSIDRRPEFASFEPTIPANTLAALVEAPLDVLGPTSVDYSEGPFFVSITNSAGKVYLGGEFTDFMGGRKYLVRLNNDGTLDTGFNPLIEAIEEWNPASVEKMALDETNNRLYIYGNRIEVDGTVRCLACLNATTGALITDFPTLLANGSNVYTIHNLVVGDDDWLYVNGNVTFDAPISHVCVGYCRIDLAGDIDTTFVLTDGVREHTPYLNDKIIGASATGQVLFILGDSSFVEPGTPGNFSNISFGYFTAAGGCIDLSVPVEPSPFATPFFKRMADGTMFIAGNNGVTPCFQRLNADCTHDATFEFLMSSLPVGSIIRDIVHVSANDHYVFTGAVKDVESSGGDPFAKPYGFVETDEFGTLVASTMPIYFTQSVRLAIGLGSDRYLFAGGEMSKLFYWHTYPRCYVTPCKDLVFVTHDP